MGQLFTSLAPTTAPRRKKIHGGGPVAKKRKTSEPSRTYRRLRSALEKVGFRARLLDKVLDEKVSRAYEDYNDQDAVKDLWHRWIKKGRESFDATKGLGDILYSYAGIRRSTTTVYARVFGPIWNFGHTSLDDLVEVIIEYALDKYAPLRSSKTQKFLLQDDHDFMSPLVGVHPKLTNTKIKHANVYSISEATLAKEFGLNDSLRLFFHTTNWEGAANMTNDRPLVEFGRRCLDFGKSRSFYMTPTLSTAISWAEKNRRCWHGECAIVVFLIRTAELAELDSLVFDTPDDKWGGIVKDSRQCRKQPPRNSADDLDIVSGPMVANATDVAFYGADPTPHRPTVLLQAAVKSRKAEALLGRSMAAVIWLRGSAP